MAIFRFIPALILSFFALLVLLSPFISTWYDEVEMEPSHLMKQIPLPEMLVPHMKLITHDLDLSIIYIELDCKPSQLKLHEELTAKGWIQDEKTPFIYNRGTKKLHIREKDQMIRID